MPHVTRMKKSLLSTNIQKTSTKMLIGFRYQIVLKCNFLYLLKRPNVANREAWAGHTNVIVYITSPDDRIRAPIPVSQTKLKLI